MLPCVSVFIRIHSPRGLSTCGLLMPGAAVVLALLLAGGLVGCGVAPGNGSQASSTKTMAAGCPGGAAAGGGEAAPALVLTAKDANQESKVHVGDVIQVRLPATQRWTVEKDGASTLELTQPVGYWDARASACVWNFRGATVGTTTVRFVGMAICEPGQVCPAYAVVEEFPVTVV